MNFSNDSIGYFPSVWGRARSVIKEIYGTTPFLVDFAVLSNYFNVSSLHELFDTVTAQNIFLVLLEILGFIVSCNVTFIRLIDFTILLLLFLILL